MEGTALGRLSRSDRRGEIVRLSPRLSGPVFAIVLGLLPASFNAKISIESVGCRPARTTISQRRLVKLMRLSSRDAFLLFVCESSLIQLVSQDDRERHRDDDGQDAP